jgi:hypothetical protein
VQDCPALKWKSIIIIIIIDIIDIVCSGEVNLNLKAKSPKFFYLKSVCEISSGGVGISS